MSAFTKGPWEIAFGQNDDVIMCGQDIVAVLYGASPQDAYKMAASPDMYEALENLLIAIGMGWDAEGCEDVAKAALAEARGE